MVEKALDKYFIPGGKPADKPYRSLPLWTLEPSRQTEEATILGNYCEVWLAKHNDDGTPTGGLVGINLLTKVSLVRGDTLPFLSSPHVHAKLLFVLYISLQFIACMAQC